MIEDSRSGVKYLNNTSYAVARVACNLPALRQAQDERQHGTLFNCVPFSALRAENGTPKKKGTTGQVLFDNRTMSALHSQRTKRYNHFNFNSRQGTLNTTGHALPAGT